jgi:hypothetical protein
MSARARRCDNCGRKARRPHSLGTFAGRTQYVCSDCLGKVARGIACVDRAVRSYRKAVEEHGARMPSRTEEVLS